MIVKIFLRMNWQMHAFSSVTPSIPLLHVERNARYVWPNIATLEETRKAGWCVRSPNFLTWSNMEKTCFVVFFPFLIQTAGVQPWWIQGIRSGDEVNKERFIYKERLGKNSVVGKLVEKRGWITWFTQETNKAPRQGVCTIYIGHRRPLE